MFSNSQLKFIERYAPYYSFFITLIIVFTICNTINWYISKTDFSTWLNISLALAAIYLGFVSAAIGEVISIIDSNLMTKLYEFDADVDLIKYIKHSALSSVALFVFSSIFSFYPCEGIEGIPILMFSFWASIFVSSFLYAGRIIYYLFTILAVINKQKKNDFLSSKKHKVIKSENISKKPIMDNPFVE